MIKTVESYLMSQLMLIYIMYTVYVENWSIYFKIR